MTMAVELSNGQVASAGRLFRSMPRWRLAEESLLQLSDAMPGFDLRACLVKAVAVNAIFGAQVLAIMRMAEWVHDKLGGLFESPTPEVPTALKAMPPAPLNLVFKGER